MEHSAEDSTVTEHDTSGKDQCGAFCTTHWSLVLTAGNGDQAGAATALEELCAKYWYPLYAFVRRRGFPAHEAEDLTQAFFAHLLEKETLKHADVQRGKFRTFLLSALMNFLSNQWDKKQAWKRGGQLQIISLDETVAEERYRQEPAEQVTPEKLFERRWALTLLKQVLAKLKHEYSAAGKARLFAKLEPCLAGTPTPGLYAEWATVLDMNEGAVRVALHRLRRRYGELLRSEIGETVAKADDVEDEIRHLFAAISA